MKCTRTLYKILIVIVLLTFIVLTLSKFVCERKQNESMLSTLNSVESIKNYAVYYGKDRIDRLSNFDLVIVQPEEYSKKEIETLKKHKTIVLAYLSLGEVSERYFKYAKGCIVGKNKNWNTYYVNVSCKKWQNFILNKAIPSILNKGFNGLFLDCVDVDKMTTKKGMVNLIKKIRQKYPYIILIQNRGFSIINETAPYVNGVLFECFTTHYNWSSKKYELWKGEDLKWIEIKAKELLRLKKKYGLVVLTLDYAENKTLKKVCLKHAEKYRFIPYVSNIYLNKILN